MVARDLLKQVGISEHPADDADRSLSGGERQAVAIARRCISTAT